MLWCQLFSEPGAGSDLAGLTTSADLDGDHYIVNGQKVWCSNGQFAEYGILLARTARSSPSHAGITFFLVDMASPGIDVRPLKQMTGDEEFTEVFLDDVAIPAENRLGDDGAGWRVAMDVLQDERGSGGAAGAISLERRLTTLAADLTDNSPVRRDHVASMLVDGRALVALLKRAVDDPAGASTSKLARTEFDFAAHQLEVSLRGADAMLAGGRTDDYLYSPGMRIAGGSSEIQRNIIGERALGLPREPKASG
jgi:alkylation response protein AidB-like acyl-CoA dehydrogenase